MRSFRPARCEFRCTSSSRMQRGTCADHCVTASVRSLSLRRSSASTFRCVAVIVMILAWPSHFGTASTGHCGFSLSFRGPVRVARRANTVDTTALWMQAENPAQRKFDLLLRRHVDRRTAPVWRVGIVGQHRYEQRGDPPSVPHYSVHFRQRRLPRQPATSVCSARTTSRSTSALIAGVAGDVRGCAIGTEGCWGKSYPRGCATSARGSRRNAA